MEAGSRPARPHHRIAEARLLVEAMLAEHGDWMALGTADEQKEPKPGTVEAWGRSPQNPVSDEAVT